MSQSRVVVQNFTEIGSSILAGQIGEVLVFLLTNTLTNKQTNKQTNKLFHLAYRSQIWTELNELMLITGADVPFGGLDDDFYFRVQTP